MEILKLEDVPKVINDNDSVMVNGFVGIGVPEDMLVTLQENYKKTSHPKDLTLIFCAGQGDGKERGLNHLAEPGMVAKAYGGHFGLSPKLTKNILEGRTEGYNLPQGVVSHLIRATASKVPYIVSEVGLDTFVDPRLEGGKMNDISTDNPVTLIEEDGKELLKYRTFKPNVALLRGTYADKRGNISFAKEALVLDGLAMAQAVRNHGGKVIVQVLDIVDEVFDPKSVVIPGILVDYVVKCEDENNHMQTFSTQFNDDLITSSKVSKSLPPIELSDRKVIARRSAMELTMHDKVLNYGIGIPEVIANVLNEEGLEANFVPTVEPGVIGGTPQGGLDFGASVFPDMILEQASQFDFYDGGGIDCTFLGLAQADAVGNLNVSRFGVKIAGCGGFINISQNAKRVVFCGTFMAGAKTRVENNKLVIEKEGHTVKFVEQVEQVTFSGKYAVDKKIKVLFITERAVFDINYETSKLRLLEIAPGIDLEKDVLAHMDFRPEIHSELKIMDSSIFNEGTMNLKIC